MSCCSVAPQDGPPGDPSSVDSVGQKAGGDGDSAGSAADSYTIGLSMYSLRQLFQSGELHAFDYPQFAKDTFGITKIDVWEGGFPQDKRDDPEFYRELRARADAAGSEIFLWMAGVVKADSAKPAERALEAQEFFAPIEFAAMLGARYVRVFLGAPDGDRNTAIGQSIDVLTPIANYAASKGRTIVIEPGASKWSAQGDFLAEVVQAMNHPNCRLMPDFGKMPLEGLYDGTIAMMPYTEVVSAKSHDFDEDGNEVKFDYARLMKSVKDAGFTGIVAIEYEGSNLPPVEGVRATQALLKRHQD